MLKRADPEAYQRPKLTEQHRSEAYQHLGGSDAAGFLNITISSETLDATRSKDGLIDTSIRTALLQLRGRNGLSQLQTHSEAIANATASKTTTGEQDDPTDRNERHNFDFDIGTPPEGGS